MCNEEVAKNVTQQPFVSPLPQTVLNPSQTVVASTQEGKRNGPSTTQKQSQVTITDIFPPANFDVRSESHGMYSKHFLTSDQTHELLGVSFVMVNSGVLLLKIEELLVAVSGAARVVFRPRPKLSIPYWDILRVRSQS